MQIDQLKLINNCMFFSISDQGRQIQITAGFQNYSLNVEDEKVAESSTTTLFEAIEDVAEKPLPTPL